MTQEVTSYLRDQGINVFPCKPKSKEPLFKWKESFIGEIDPKSNIGVTCGYISNLVVYDFDNKELLEYFEEFKTKTYMVETGRGFHIYSLTNNCPDTTSYENSKGQHIDLKAGSEKRGTLSYVIGEGSIHESGKLYTKISDSRKIRNIIAEIEPKLKKLGFKRHGLVNTDPSKKGNRNNHFFKKALDLIKLKKLNLEETTEALLKKNSTIEEPLEESEIRTICQSALNYVDTQREQPIQPDDEEQVTHERIANIIMESFVFKTIPENEQIYVYEDGVFKDNAESLIKEETQKMKSNCKNSFVKEVIGTIIRRTYLTRKEEFDDYPNYINLNNGILNLVTEELEEHTPEKLFRYKLNVNYDPNAKCSNFMNFLSDVLPNDTINQERVIEMFASTLWTNSRLEKAFMLIGSGRNGKSITLMTLQDIIGYRSISNISIHDLINNRFKQAKLEGKLLNIYPDIRAREIEESGVLKPIISGERITVENKMEKPHEIKNRAKLIFSANQLPSLNTSSDGDFRRWFVIEFNQKFEGKNQDTKLFEKLTLEEEKSGILNLMIDRLKLMKENGNYSYEQSVEEVREIWESKSNSAYRFIQSRLKIDVLGSIPVSKMVEDYEQYCIQNKLAVKPSHSFGLTLKRLFPNVESVQRKIEGINQRVWSGVSL